MAKRGVTGAWRPRGLYAWGNQFQGLPPANSNDLYGFTGAREAGPHKQDHQRATIRSKACQRGRTALASRGMAPDPGRP